MKNWKTTLAGISSIIGGISIYFNHPEQIEAALSAVALGIGLILSKDYDNNIGGGSNNSFSTKEEDPIVGDRPGGR